MYKYGKYNVYYLASFGVKGYTWIIHKKGILWGWNEFARYDNEKYMKETVDELKRSGNIVIPA